MHELHKLIVIQLVLPVIQKNKLTLWQEASLLIQPPKNEASSKVQEQLRSSSPSKTHAKIKKEVFDELMYEEENPIRLVSFSFNVDRSDVFRVHGILRKGGSNVPMNDVELKRVMRNGQITDEFVYAIEVALCMTSYQVSLQMVVFYLYSFAFFFGFFVWGALVKNYWPAYFVYFSISCPFWFGGHVDYDICYL
ncbi:hypothetical protein Cgig2_034195 [Carnegiea gigantea]|uniref:Uncharacterized protein n=1 Tax=Carnegiea gigantea TaxID=171969 RepID=A0A9Q1JKM3_9CARY|nr:hypothetical protein Cgig2_034195 [Carnegiea gigantea]